MPAHAREHEDIINVMGEGESNYHLKHYNVVQGEAFNDLNKEQ